MRMRAVAEKAKINKMRLHLEQATRSEAKLWTQPAGGEIGYDHLEK